MSGTCNSLTIPIGPTGPQGLPGPAGTDTFGFVLVEKTLTNAEIMTGGSSPIVVAPAVVGKAYIFMGGSAEYTSGNGLAVMTDVNIILDSLIAEQSNFSTVGFPDPNWKGIFKVNPVDNGNNLVYNKAATVQVAPDSPAVTGSSLKLNLLFRLI